MRTLSLEPLAFVIDGYLEADIASLVIEEAIAAGPAFQRSVFAATDGNAVMDKMRTSQQVTLIPGVDRRLLLLSRRTAILTRLPLISSDASSILYSITYIILCIYYTNSIR